MNFIIKKDILLENLNNTSKAISSKNLIPILSGIKFELKEDGLYLYASDTDVTIRTFIDKSKITEIKELGSIVIGGKYIVDIVRKLPDTDIKFEVIDGYKMLISTDNTEFNLNGINPSEFPDLDLEMTKEPIILNTEIFKTIINQTYFATSQNESRPLLTGINFIISNNKLEVMATDSYRLSKKEITLDTNIENDINVVIPAKNLVELSKMMVDDDILEIHLFNNKVLFKYKNIIFLSRLLSGDYPATAKIIPTEFMINITCDFSTFFDMIDRASLLTSDKDKNIIKLELTTENLIVSSNSPEIGKVEEKIKMPSEKSIKISFSSKYMLEAIKSFNQDTITICMNDDSSPIVIKSSKEQTLIQLVLPIKTY